jgi:cytochrome c553
MVTRVIAMIGGCLAIALVAAGSAHAADQLETRVQVCASCHGASGTPVIPVTPNIWGQRSDYLYKQLHDFKSGARMSPIMGPIVKDMSFDDLRELANYFAAKSWPSTPAADPAAKAPEGIAMCKACHQQNFQGGPPAPRVAGLDYEYLRNAMNGFAHGERTNNLDMPGFMKSLSDSQRDAIAKYLAGL